MASEVDLSKEVNVDKDGEIVVESEEDEKRRVEGESKEATTSSAEEKTGGGVTDDEHTGVVAACVSCQWTHRLVQRPSADVGRRAISVPAGYRSYTQCGVQSDTDVTEYQ